MSKSRHIASSHEPGGFCYRRCAATTISGTLIGAFLLLSISAVAGTQGVHRSGLAWQCALQAPRLVVLKGARRMHLFDADQLVRTYRIDLGTSPVGQKLRAGDGRTPLGRFRIVTKNEKSPYARFMGISYPDTNAADRGHADGLVSIGLAGAIRAAFESGACPNWSTGLGGGIGVHGGRQGSDWTAGCIAVSDAAVRELFDVLRIGDPVDILP